MVSILKEMNDWVYVTNRILDRGGEVMLYDTFFNKIPKKKNIFKEVAKASAVVLYYAIRYLV